MNKIITCALVIFLIAFINCECPTISTAREDKSEITRFDCFAQSNGTHLCCYDGEKCEAIDNLNSEKDLDNLLSEKKLDCGINEEIYKEYEFTPYRPSQPDIDLGLQNCGRTQPKKKKHCTDYSSIMNSCCYFKFDTDQAGCYYLGKKYSGNSDKHTFGTYTYECHETSIRKSFFVLFSFVLLFVL